MGNGKTHILCRNNYLGITAHASARYGIGRTVLVKRVGKTLRALDYGITLYHTGVLKLDHVVVLTEDGVYLYDITNGGLIFHSVKSCRTVCVVEAVNVYGITLVIGNIHIAVGGACDLGYSAYNVVFTGGKDVMAEKRADLVHLRDGESAVGVGKDNYTALIVTKVVVIIVLVVVGLAPGLAAECAMDTLHTGGAGKIGTAVGSGLLKGAARKLTLAVVGSHRALYVDDVTKLNLTRKSVEIKSCRAVAVRDINRHIAVALVVCDINRNYNSTYDNVGVIRRIKSLFNRNLLIVKAGIVAVNGCGCTLGDLSASVVGCHSTLYGDDVTKLNLGGKAVDVELVALTVLNGDGYVAEVVAPYGVDRANRTAYFNLLAVGRSRRLGNSHYEVMVGIVNAAELTNVVYIAVIYGSEVFVILENGVTGRAVYCVGRSAHRAGGISTGDNHLGVTEGTDNLLCLIIIANGTVLAFGKACIGTAGSLSCERHQIMTVCLDFLGVA